MNIFLIILILFIVIGIGIGVYFVINDEKNSSEEEINMNSSIDTNSNVEKSMNNSQSISPVYTPTPTPTPTYSYVSTICDTDFAKKSVASGIKCCWTDIDSETNYCSDLDEETCVNAEFTFCEGETIESEDDYTGIDICEAEITQSIIDNYNWKCCWYNYNDDGIPNSVSCTDYGRYDCESSGNTYCSDTVNTSSGITLTPTPTFNMCQQEEVIDMYNNSGMQCCNYDDDGYLTCSSYVKSQCTNANLNWCDFESNTANGDCSTDNYCFTGSGFASSGYQSDITDYNLQLLGFRYDDTSNRYVLQNDIEIQSDEIMLYLEFDDNKCFIDGNGKTITINTSDKKFSGLFIQNDIYRSSGNYRFHNIFINMNGCSLNEGCGALISYTNPTTTSLSSDLDGICSELKIFNCGVYEGYLNSNCGGLVGSYVNYGKDSKTLIYNCFSQMTGNDDISNCGGIVGSYANYLGGIYIIFNSYFYGDVTADGFGGIVGANACNYINSTNSNNYDVGNGGLYIYNCYYYHES